MEILERRRARHHIVQNCLKMQRNSFGILWDSRMKKSVTWTMSETPSLREARRNWLTQSMNSLQSLTIASGLDKLARQNWYHSWWPEKGNNTRFPVTQRQPGPSEKNVDEDASSDADETINWIGLISQDEMRIDVAAIEALKLIE